MDHYVYTYIDPRNGEVFYVGKGQGRRAYWHLNRKDKHPMTHRIQKMLREGIEPDIILTPCASEEEALNEERGRICLLGRKDQGKGPLLNLTDGGEVGPTNRDWSAESRAKISIARKGKPLSEKHRQKLARSHTGKTFPESTRKKMSEARKRYWNG